MDYNNYTTFFSERKRWQHLSLIDRGAIQHLHRLGLSNRKIARQLGCSPTTISNELRRGSAKRSNKRGRPTIYLATRGEAVYRLNRLRCRRQHLINTCQNFVRWVCQQLKLEKWSFDVSVGYAKKHNLFKPNEMVCVKTLYNELTQGNLPITAFDLPIVLKRRKNNVKRAKIARTSGRSIEERIIAFNEFGHWEGDTIIGKKKGKESVILTLNEKLTNQYIAIKIPGKTSVAVNKAMKRLRLEYREKFSQVFKTITVDNGKEFNKFYALEKYGTKIYYAHPYSSWERGQNERNNGMFRAYVPKGVSIENYSEEEILMYADELNTRPRKKLNYSTPEELFEDYLDKIYAL